MKPITIKGNTYRSIASAWRNLSPKALTLEAVRWRLREGWSEEDAILVTTVHPRIRRVFKDLRNKC
jgi:hypothetical protein